MVTGHCHNCGVAVEAGESFLQDLHGEWGALNSSVPRAAQKVWTSAKKFKPAFGAAGTEFCSLWSDVIRRDQASVARASAIIARALNQNLVTPAPGQDRAAALGNAAFPPQPCCWRGGGFGLPPPEAGSAAAPPPVGASPVSPSRLREFFDARAADGKPYRTKQFLATSFSEDTAKEFIGRAHQGNANTELCKWKVRGGTHGQDAWKVTSRS